jgi:hypothetical protein
MSFLILGSKFVVSEDDSDSVLRTMTWVEETSSLYFSMGTQDLQKLGRVYVAHLVQEEFHGREGWLPASIGPYYFAQDDRHSLVSVMDGLLADRWDVFLDETIPAREANI